MASSSSLVSEIGKQAKDLLSKNNTSKIRIVVRSFDRPSLEKHFGGLPPFSRHVRLPESRVLYTVLRSPHIDKKSREQFQMVVKKQLLDIKTESHELHKKLFWLKRQNMFGAQYEIVLSCKTRLDNRELQKLLQNSDQ